MQSKKDHPTTIEIYILKNDRRIANIAKLSYDTEPDINWISQRYVDETLEVAYRESKEEDYVRQVHGIDMKAKGTVELEWS